MGPQFSTITGRLHAFTLVEVALAIAIMAFVLVTLAGVWPSGQDQLKGAMDMTIAGHLAQRISAEVEVADFPDVLKAAGIAGQPVPAKGALPRRYFSYEGREVARDDSERVYEVLTRVVHREQLPALAGRNAARWDAQGQLVLTIEVVASPNGALTPVGEDGLADRKHCRRPVTAFPFVVGGNSTW